MKKTSNRVNTLKRSAAGFVSATLALAGATAQAGSGNAGGSIDRGILIAQETS